MTCIRQKERVKVFFTAQEYLLLYSGLDSRSPKLVQVEIAQVILKEFHCLRAQGLALVWPVLPSLKNHYSEHI